MVHAVLQHMDVRPSAQERREIRIDSDGGDGQRHRRVGARGGVQQPAKRRRQALGVIIAPPQVRLTSRGPPKGEFGFKPSAGEHAVLSSMGRGQALRGLLCPWPFSPTSTVS